MICVSMPVVVTFFTCRGTFLEMFAGREEALGPARPGPPAASSPFWKEARHHATFIAITKPLGLSRMSDPQATLRSHMV